MKNFFTNQQDAAREQTAEAVLQPEPEKQACRCLMRGRHQTQPYVNGFHTEGV